MILLLYCYAEVISVAVFPPLIKDSCAIRPSNCNLLCINGYRRQNNEECACECAADPCQFKLCAIGEHCTVIGGVAGCISNTGAPRHECPRIIGGLCNVQCKTDSDCPGHQICCSNGCGRKCMFPLAGFPIETQLPGQPIQARSFHRLVTDTANVLPALSKPIRPVNATIAPVSLMIDRSFAVKTPIPQQKAGMCPPAGDEKACTTYTKCSDDTDCKDVEKCCKNACGSVCVDPTKATNCIHFAITVKKLPEQKLKYGYVPKCDSSGKFSPIQCDERICWCVDVNYGMEIAGSSVPVGMKRAGMCRGLINPCPIGPPMTLHRWCDGSMYHI
ncbi:unnamed protein product [Cylicocyclus nassatus]|uniref:Uncharacterized protein n=1 Tax=Cylicocyclus nassatus TaxID=53992 RepID=A0AA36H4E4_CYLNA|nr:unnamed protein product [Cylicocyclus nassatus]